MVLPGGCAAPIVGSLTVGHLVSAASAVTIAAKGKGVSEIVLDAATGKDCRFLEGAVRKDREICETPGSPATRSDFKGVSTVVGMLEAERVRAAERPPAARTRVAAALDR